ncbi:MAG: hypothetical protein M1837_001249 [Sclerophora amabilis]|nr:MAG: hypothetical protein M1837_001249 [Sclerophora amabilis]
MSSTMSKRQQARNERALQELIKTVPGNDRCADCQAKNPGWASWSNMKRAGNVVSNRVYTPNNSKPNLPLDVDEVDSAMERFIRQKYEHRLFQGGHIGQNYRQNTGSTSASSEEPPPLPPKPGQRFGPGFRAASSTFPLSTRHDAMSRFASRSPDYTRPSGRTPSPVKSDGHATVFGASVGGESFESKLATLKEMGFSDEKRNATVLKGLSGSVERTIETLVRLGEGGPKSSKAQSALATNLPITVPPAGSSRATPISTQPAISAPQNQRTHGSSAEFLQHPIPPQRTGVLSAPSQDEAQRNPFNPFLFDPRNSSRTQPLDRAFENLAVSQPLFPNATGGFPQQPPHDIPYHQTLTPPIQSTTHQHYFPTSSQPQVHPYFQSQYPQSQAINGISDPFFSQASGASMSSNPYQNHVPLQQGQHQPMSGHNNAPHYTPNQYSQTQHTGTPSQQHVVQQTNQTDKSNIMALYNYPQLAPAPMPSSQGASLSAISSGDPSNPTVPNVADGVSSFGHRSVSMPTGPSAGSRNPFLTNGGPPVSEEANAKAPPTRAEGVNRHVSQESVDVGGWQSGRHSPDAFASLSARFVR